MLNYLINNWFEVFAVITALIYIYFSINRSMWLWIVGMIYSGMYVVIFFRQALYADMALNFYYVVISIYGLIDWLINIKSYNKKTTKVLIRKIDKKGLQLSSLFFILLFALIYTPIKIIPDKIGIDSASLPFIDSSLSALSIVATWMLAKRYLEQWLIWIFVNGSYILVYLYKGLYATIFLSLVFTIMSIIGYIKWKKTIELKNNYE